MTPRLTIEERLSRIRPEPSARFYRRMAGAPWTRASGTKGLLMDPKMRFAGVLVLAALVLAALLALTPMGRAWAQALLGYFIPTTQTWFPVPISPTHTPVPTYILTSVPETLQPAPAVDAEQCGPGVSPVSSTFACQLANAEAEMGFEILAFPADRIELDFEILIVEPDSGLVSIFYRGEQAFYQITQGQGSMPAARAPWDSAPAEAIRQVSVGDSPAEFVAGGFTSLDGINHFWTADYPEYRLRWQADGRWFEASRSLGMPLAEAGEQLIGLAENLVGLSQGTAALAGGDTPTVEQEAGFDVKEPAALPGGFRLCSAQYITNSLSVPRFTAVTYCFTEDGKQAGSLSLYQTPVTVKEDLRWEFLSLTGGGILPTDEQAQVDGRPGRYLAAEDGSQALLWSDADFKYMLVLNWSASYGGRFGTADLIAVAESVY